MTDEEKQSIKDCDEIFIHLDDMMSEESANDYRKSYLTLTNLIEKQSKEIEELNKYKEGYKLLSYSLDNYTSNDKIKAKIEEWQKEKEFYNKDEDREWGQYNNWDWIDTIINEMQSLLKKE